MSNTNLNLNDVVEERNLNEEKQHLLLVPYQDKKEDFVIKSMKKKMETLLPTNIKTKIALTGSKLSTVFQVKNEIKFEDNILFIMLPVLKLIVQKIILEGMHVEYQKVQKIVYVKMYNRIFSNMQLKVDMK